MIRAARPEDVPLLVGFVRELAEYERAAHEVKLTDERLHALLFGPDPQVFCSVAVPDGGVSGGVSGGGEPAPVGFAVWFVSFSTWLGQHGIYLEDLYVRAEHRRGGHGRALLAHLAGICAERGYGRLEWSVLNWNEDAHRFYRSIGAAPQDEWTVWRLAGGGLADLGGGRTRRLTRSRRVSPLRHR